MTLTPLLCRAALAGALMVSGLARAQAGPEAPAPAPQPSAAPASCRALTDQALAADLQAASAQGQRQPPAQVAALYEAAAQHWSQAAAQCEGRAGERARRNLDDSRKAAAALQETLGAGAACTAAHKDATALQDLATQAVGERRWSEAALLYRKAETMWDAAAEHCSGAPQQQALARREQSETDGHNAEFCAPVFARAREQAQRLRSSGAGMEEAQRRQLSQVVETLWRDAATRCKGNAQELARSNAQTVARERGTPWVATADPGTPVRGAGAAAASAATPAPLAAGALAAAKGGGQAGAPAPATAPAPSEPATAAQPQPAEFTAGDTRYAGRFVLERDGTTPVYSGQGRVTWANGDVYEGLMVRGQRHGQGRFTWHSGQQYEGEWVQGSPQGRGRMKFANGNDYEGEIADGEPHGQGRMLFATGDRYSGRFERGAVAGRGEYLWRNGQRYEGAWQDELPHGQGTMRFANGDVYEGPFHRGQPQGEGRMRYASGDSYTGPFAAGLPEGAGRYEWKNGDRYQGGFKAGRKDGAGTLVWANGSRWEGEFRNDQQHDAGTLTPAPQGAQAAAKL